MSRSPFDPTRDYDQEAKDARIDDVNDRSTYEVLETIMSGADATTPDTGIKTIREKIGNNILRLPKLLRWLRRDRLALVVWWILVVSIFVVAVWAALKFAARIGHDEAKFHPVLYRKGVSIIDAPDQEIAIRAFFVPLGFLPGKHHRNRGNREGRYHFRDSAFREDHRSHDLSGFDWLQFYPGTLIDAKRVSAVFELLLSKIGLPGHLLQREIGKDGRERGKNKRQAGEYSFALLPSIIAWSLILFGLVVGGYCFWQIEYGTSPAILWFFTLIAALCICAYGLSNVLIRGMNVP